MEQEPEPDSKASDPEKKWNNMLEKLQNANKFRTT
jgi:hypothetical protein